MKKVILFGHDLLKQYVLKEDVTVDMTAGNGYDTLFLASISRKVYAFDIQDQAINNTKKILAENDVKNVKLIKDSHEFVRKYVDCEIGGAIFNLGYLPGSNKLITTEYQTTIIAIENILKIIKRGGICVIVVYPGHPAGFKESIHIEEFLKTVPQDQFSVLKYQFINQVNAPPYLLAIYKK